MEQLVRLAGEHDADSRLLSCLTLELRHQRRFRGPEVEQCLVRTAADVWRTPLQAAIRCAWHDDQGRAASGEPLAMAADDALDRFDGAKGDLLEQLLDAVEPGKRSRNGVYYTPRPLALWLIDRAHQALQRMGLPGGLLDEATWSEAAVRLGIPLPEGASPQDPFVQIVDPAAGAGAFLTALLQWAERRGGPAAAATMLARVRGHELLADAAAICHLRMVWQLLESGTPAARIDSIDLRVADTLAGPPASSARPATVVVGNPPFLGASPRRGPWIDRLLRGRGEGSESASYFDVDGEPLGERKVWLNDDYIRFVRWAQWRIETSGAGVVSMVLNHGLLDNVTFRGARQKLASAFQQLDLLDLHGGANARERSPDGRRDQNVFAVATGIAACTFARAASLERRVRRADLWGSREEKLAQLDRWRQTSGDPPWRPLPCRSPHYRFDHAVPSGGPDYRAGPRLTELMPVCTTAPVTARDRFIVDRSRERLCRRLSEFADLTVPDEVIRQRHFNRTRSPRYAPGDTRGWQLADARRRLAATPDWQRHVRLIQYRPGDWRHVLWIPWMVDWPRTEVTRHLLENNVALIARRQMLAARPCDYFWSTADIALDGVIRSDNRGSESLFPLWLYERGGRRANFEPTRARQLLAAAGLRWTDSERGDLGRTAGPIDLLGYIYAVFHCPTYRRQFAGELRRDFPRVPAATRERFALLAPLGGELLALHSRPPGPEADVERLDEATSPAVQCVAPAYRHGRASLSEGLTLPVDPETWEFHVGGHQVARKWLKDRRGEPLSADEVRCYRRLLATIDKTRARMDAIDDIVRATGGWKSDKDPAEG